MNGTRKSVQIGVRQGATKTVDLDIPAGVDTGDVLETQVGWGGGARGQLGGARQGGLGRVGVGQEMGWKGVEGERAVRVGPEG